MDTFLNYESDWKELRDSIRKRAQLIPTCRGDTKRKEITLANEEIEEAEEILQSLNLSAQSIGTDACKKKVETAEDELDELKANVRRAETFFGASSDREQLFAGASDLAVTSMDQREKVLRDTDKLRHTTDVIKHALRTAGEAEQLGVQSLEQLEVQRDTIGSSRSKLRNVNESLKSAQRIMRGISRRIMTNKLITCCLAAILLGGIILIVYLKFFDTASDEMTTVTTMPTPLPTPMPTMAPTPNPTPSATPIN